MDFLKNHVARIVAEAEHVPQAELGVPTYIEELSQRVRPFTMALTSVKSKPTLNTSGPSTKVPIAPSVHNPLNCRVYNINQEAEVLALAGFGISPHEVMFLQDSINTLVASHPTIAWVRFWGKVLGREGDYSIIEVDYSGKDIASPTEESRGFGANRYAYFSFSSTTKTWTELPNVTSSQLQSSRTFKTILSGNLNSPAPAGFPGYERHLLRTAIARISAATIIAPAGFFTVNEAEISRSEDYTFSPSAPSLDNWQHARDYILRIGKTSYPEPAEGEEDSREIALAKESDPPVDKLRSITEDSPIGTLPCWSLRIVGDRGSYSFPDGEKSYAVTLIQSRRWPGAVTVCQGSLFINFYCGYGLCAEGPIFLPTEPFGVLSEPAEIDEAPEPFPFEDDTAKEVPAE